MNPCDTCDAYTLCRAAVQPPNVEFQADGVFVKQIELAVAGSIVPQHSHAYEHMTMLAVGSVDVFAAGVFAGRRTAPDAIRIAAGVKHTFVSLVDNTVLYCIHNVARTGAVEVLEEHQLVGVV